MKKLLRLASLTVCFLAFYFPFVRSSAGQNLSDLELSVQVSEGVNQRSTALNFMFKLLKTFYFLLIFSPIIVQAQQSAHSAGGDGGSSTGSVAFSIGQVVYNEFSSGTGAESQGVQQRYDLVLNLLGDDNSEQVLQKDPNTNIAFIEKVISGSEVRVASFTTLNNLLFELEAVGDRDDSGLFELIFETEDDQNSSDGRLLDQQQTTSTLVQRVSVVFKNKSIAGNYQVQLFAKDPYGNSTAVVIKVTVLADILAVVSIGNQIDIPWGSSVAIKSQQQILTSDGETPLVETALDETPLNRFARGDYRLPGELILPSFIKNPLDLKADIMVRVLTKPAPIDVSLSKNSFEGSTDIFFISVGDFQVNDPVDDIHQVSLLGDGYDNTFFEIKQNTLFWSSAQRAPGKTTFSIMVRVTDRDGNTLDKFFDITRTRPSVSSIEIFNTFTPGNDQVNNTWGVQELRFYNGVRIQLFDQGGILLFATENPDLKWDGSYQGKEMPVGTYYWVVEVKETGETRRGMLNLIRK